LSSVTHEAKRFYQEIFPAQWRRKVKEYGFSQYHQWVVDVLPVAAGDPVLECGIGTGEPLALRLAQQGARMHGVDIAQSLLGDCRRNFLNAGLHVCCAAADMDDLPYSDESFALVYSISTTWCLRNIENALREMARVTRRDGTIVFDIVSAFHVTHITGFCAARLLGLWWPDRFSPWWPRSPVRIGRILRRLGLKSRVKGYYVLLPAAHPDLCKFSEWFTSGLADSPLRYLGAKLLYVCRFNV
jgi:ubiquinone/menaquinone biosynthesis C-methylase UbiE